MKRQFTHLILFSYAALLILFFNNCTSNSFDPLISGKAENQSLNQQPDPDDNGTEIPVDENLPPLSRKVAAAVNFPINGPSPTPVRTEPAFPNLNFNQALFLTHAGDETNRLFVVEKEGRIIVFNNDTNTNQSDVFLNISNKNGLLTSGEQGLLGLAFHPDFKENGYFFVYYSQNNPRRSVISRFQVSDNNPNQADLGSEKVILEVNQPYANHNGGMMSFGPDGFLYIGLGDGGSGNDPQGHGLNTSTLLGSLLRIDVDSGDPYSIPPTNPFAQSAGNERKEIYAYGIRNPWRWSFDRNNGTLWLADVGQNRIEEINIVENGDNLGWREWEGLDSNSAVQKTVGVPLSETKRPIHQYNHSEGESVTGGYVYRGSAVPSLYGAYIYGDYRSGKVWALVERNGTKVSNTEITNIPVLTSFGEDEEGELYGISFALGIVKFRTDEPSQTEPIPQLLSETQFFKNLDSLEPVDGIYPYNVRSPLWSDGSLKKRWILLRNNDQLVSAQGENHFEYPLGATLIKHFALPNGIDKEIPVETRVLVLGEQGWQGYSYQWNEDGTDAELLGGASEKTYDYVDISGAIQQLKWNFPSRTDCLSCHTNSASFVLGVKPTQLKTNIILEGGGRNQFEAWNQLALVDSPLNQDEVEDTPGIEEDQFSLEERARSYMDTNCAMCHQPNSTGHLGRFDFRWSISVANMGIINQPPNDDLGMPGALLVKPGNHSESLLWVRINQRGDNQMPPLATEKVHSEAVKLIGDWIDSL